MDGTSQNSNRYRPGSSAIVFNESGQVLLLRFDDGLMSGWVFPSGGFETQDSDFIVTAYRELHEEAGIEPDDVELIAVDGNGFYYDFPAHQRAYWQQRGSTYRGQMKKFHLFHLLNQAVRPQSCETKIKEHRWCWREEAKMLLLDTAQYDHLEEVLTTNGFEDIFMYEPSDD